MSQFCIKRKMRRAKSKKNAFKRRKAWANKLNANTQLELTPTKTLTEDKDKSKLNSALIIAVAASDMTAKHKTELIKQLIWVVK